MHISTQAQDFPQPAFVTPPLLCEAQRHKEAMLRLQQRREGNPSAQTIRRHLALDIPYHDFHDAVDSHHNNMQHARRARTFEALVESFANAVERYCIAFSLAIIVAVIITTGGILPPFGRLIADLF